MILRPEAAQIDVLTFERLVAEGTRAVARSQAADLYRGPFLEGLDVDEEPFEAWLTAERERLHELALEGAGAAAGAAPRRGRSRWCGRRPRSACSPSTPPRSPSTAPS